MFCFYCCRRECFVGLWALYLRMSSNCGHHDPAAVCGPVERGGAYTSGHGLETYNNSRGTSESVYWRCEGHVKLRVDNNVYMGMRVRFAC